MLRGVVCTPLELTKTADGSGFTTGSGLTKLDLNYFTLYWDKIVSPTSNFYHFCFSNEDDLIACGVLERPTYSTHDGRMHDSFFPEFYAAAQIDALQKKRSGQGDVDWRMHFHNAEIALPRRYSIEKETIRFELLNALPVPDVDTHLHEILEFKERRRAELDALHSYLDELYLDVIRSGDLNLQKAKSLSALKGSISDIQKLNGEKFRSPIKFDLSSSFEFKLSDLASAAGAIASVVHGKYDLAAALGFKPLVEFIGGCISVKPVLQNMKIPCDPNLAYICKARSEGVIK
ncbi:DUF6236 family protein [Citrobacter sp. RHBSTW-00944]|uniref:DUF6236 family protein n=1 Tax=Citrobacter TaxID=544 RepID=UPI0015E50B78|nr:DUF6236 family protein [Citrobacter sp. RHBSTW-00944]HBB9909692.1 hypothetical protein [Citrobacter freundii]QLO83891.1 hypothetical protein HV334_08675 [Citrobacter sp. RHBSTW-00944]HBC2002119.1 hypothetical protein [Citrobacter freundii]HBM8408803.1 hypothetical protein [Citrobacter freundii]HBM9445694.1 hypothetical protein [Citrobacter freundii]